MDDNLLAKLKRIENRYAVILLAMVPVAQTVVGDLTVTFGLALGGGLELLAFFVLRRFAEKIVDSTRQNKATLLAMAVAANVALLGVGIVLAFTVLPVDAIAFIVGILLIFVSVAIEAVWPEGRRQS